MSVNTGCLKVNILYNEAGRCFYVLFIFVSLPYILLNNKKCVRDYMYMMGLCVPAELPT